MNKLHYTSKDGVTRLFRSASALSPIATFNISENSSHVQARLTDALNQLKASSPIPLDIFNSKGLVRKVGLYAGYWRLSFTKIPVSLRADRMTLEADVEYITLRLCMHYGISEDSVTSHVMRHALRSLFLTKRG